MSSQQEAWQPHLPKHAADEQQAGSVGAAAARCGSTAACSLSGKSCPATPHITAPVPTHQRRPLLRPRLLLRQPLLLCLLLLLVQLRGVQRRQPLAGQRLVGVVRRCGCCGSCCSRLGCAAAASRCSGGAGRAAARCCVLLLQPPLIQRVQPLLQRLLVSRVERRHVAGCSTSWQVGIADQ